MMKTSKLVKGIIVIAVIAIMIPTLAINVNADDPKAKFENEFENAFWDYLKEEDCEDYFELEVVESSFGWFVLIETTPEGDKVLAGDDCIHASIYLKVKEDGSYSGFVHEFYEEDGEEIVKSEHHYGTDVFYDLFG